MCSPHKPLHFVKYVPLEIASAKPFRTHPSHLPDSAGAVSLSEDRGQGGCSGGRCAASVRFAAAPISIAAVNDREVPNVLVDAVRDMKIPLRYYRISGIVNAQGLPFSESRPGGQLPA
jgi:hypothetical protein